MFLVDGVEHKILPESLRTTDTRSLTRLGLLTETVGVFHNSHESWYCERYNTFSKITNEWMPEFNFIKKCFMWAAPYKSMVKIILSLRMRSDVSTPTIGSHENLQLSEPQHPLTQNVDKFQIWNDSPCWSNTDWTVFGGKIRFSGNSSFPITGQYGARTPY